MFYSILFPSKEHEPPLQKNMPESFADLLVDQLIDTVAFKRQEFDLRSLLCTPLTSIEAINYRQEVLRDLEDEQLRGAVDRFSHAFLVIGSTMRELHETLKMDGAFGVDYLSRGRTIDCVDWYCREVSALSEALSGMQPRSAGMKAFSDYIITYAASPDFLAAKEHGARLREQFSEIEFCMMVELKPTAFGMNKELRAASVYKYTEQEDYAEILAECFAKFRAEDTNMYKRALPDMPPNPRIENSLLKIVEGLYKETFADLERFCKKYGNAIDPAIERFSNEVQLYIAWLETVRAPAESGLHFCYPKVLADREHIYARDNFNMTLACDILDKIVTNEFELNTPERIFVITGPNQGGKTTFARAFAQTHYLASLGLTVPGRDAQLTLFSNILTHFGREEDIEQQNGQLRDDLIRLKALLEQANSNSLIIINEIFASTTLTDAVKLGGYMMDTLSKLGACVICVTFLEELAVRGEETVSMVGVVREDDPSARTFKVARRQPDGLAYAEHIAEKFGLSYDRINGRLAK